MGLDCKDSDTCSNYVRKLVAELPSVICGDFSRLDFSTTKEYVAALNENITFLEAQALSPFLPHQEKQVQLISRARDVVARVELQRRKKLIRRQPFGIIISGDPGCGKSFAAMKLATCLYNSIHGKLDAEQLIVLNEGDEFQSEFRTTHKVVVFDDLGATRVVVVPKDPFRKIIDFINNIPRTALNPNLELKGNVWIEPEIVVATTNMPIPFISEQGHNTETMLCHDAMNRRFIVKLVQMGYNKFVIIPNVPGIKVHRERGRYLNEKMYTFDQILEITKIQYREHYDEQTKFLNLVEKGLEIEGMSNSLFVFSAIVSLQAAVRYYIANLSYKEKIAEASTLTLIRHFAALDLQHLKVHAKQAIIIYLRNHENLSTTEILNSVDIFQKRANLCGTILSLASLGKAESIMDAVVRLVPIITNYAIKYVPVHPLIPSGTAHVVYDISSIVLPVMVKRVIDAFSTRIDTTVVCSNINSAYELTKKKMNRISSDIYNIFYGKVLQAESKNHACSYPVRLFETVELFRVNITRSTPGPFESDPYSNGMEVYEDLQKYKQKELPLRQFFQSLGSMQVGRLHILYGMNLHHQRFTFGPYFMVYNEDRNVVYIIRTVNSKLRFNLNEMFPLIKLFNETSGTRIVFVGKAVSRLVVASLFAPVLQKEIREDLDALFKLDFMAKAFININGTKMRSINAHLCNIQVGNPNREK